MASTNYVGPTDQVDPEALNLQFTIVDHAIEETLSLLQHSAPAGWS